MNIPVVPPKWRAAAFGSLLSHVIEYIITLFFVQQLRKEKAKYFCFTPA